MICIRYRSLPILALVVLLMFVIISCEAGEIISEPERETGRVQIRVEDNTFIQGESVFIEPVFFDTRGNEIEDAPPWLIPQWNIQNPDIVQLDGNRVTGLQVGNTLLELSLWDQNANTRIYVNPAEVEASIVRTSIMQSTSSPDRSIPLIAGKAGALKVYVSSDRENYFEIPNIAAQLFVNQSLLQEFELPGSRNFISFGEEDTGRSADLSMLIDGNSITEGLGMRFQFDPEHTLPLPPGFDTFFPSATELQMENVVEVSPLNVRFVPVHSPSGEGNVHTGNVNEFLDFTYRVFPLKEINAEMRTPYTTSLRMETEEEWIALIHEIRALRIADGIADGSSLYYHGISVRVGGPTGVGYLGYPVAISWDQFPAASQTVAHEFGHNFGLRHAPCGEPGGVDPNFPYWGGSIGVPGFDIVENESKPSDTYYDLMSYCGPGWISDYHYQKVLDFRKEEALNANHQQLLANQEVLLIWGQITQDGIKLEPSFHLQTVPKLPDNEGDYYIEIRNDAGNTLYRSSFTPHKVGDDPGKSKHFAFAIPTHLMAGHHIKTIRVVGQGIETESKPTLSPEQKSRLLEPGSLVNRVSTKAGQQGIEITWDDAELPMIMIRDGQTGDVLSFARGGEVFIASGAETLIIHSSYGVGSVSHEIQIQ